MKIKRTVSASVCSPKGNKQKKMSSREERIGEKWKKSKYTVSIAGRIKESQGEACQ